MKYPSFWVSVSLVFAVLVIAPSLLIVDGAAAQSGSETATLIPTVAPTKVATPAGPVKVGIREDTRGLLLTVNGSPVTITGMNYNVNYTRMPEATRLALHRRDFKVMHDAGVNAIVGWGVYDEVTLQVAQEFGIGVIMPFDLDPQGPYENQNYRDQIKSDFRTYIQRFKDYPAVWAWNPGGDELLYRMDTQQHRTSDKLSIAADFLAELSTLAYSLDPNHVSVIKEPRDLYIPPLNAAIQKARALPGEPDPQTYLMFGVDVYGHPDDVTAAILAAKQNAEQRMGIAFLVAEYGPFEEPEKDRATYYGEIWDAVYADSPNGGLVYVFGPDQPNPQLSNPYDPLHLLPNPFSLVDNQDNPIDNALATLAARYHQVRDSISSP